MNFSDLSVVLILASTLYALIVALTGRQNFLVRAVNPHRGTWLLAALSILWVGIGLLRLEALSWDLPTWGALLSQLVTDAPATARVKVASLAILLSVVFLVLVAWCWLFLPRDPSNFRRLQDRKAAFRYYVTRLRGGLDYALLARGDGERLEEAAHTKQIERMCPHLPKVLFQEGAQPRIRTAQEQVAFWREMACRLTERMGELDRLIEQARHGRNRRIVFDAQYGGFFFKYLRLPDLDGTGDTGLYLFGATVSQEEMDTQEAERHFSYLLRALQNIDRHIHAG